jgi:nucleoid DNA-binding protein
LGIFSVKQKRAKRDTNAKAKESLRLRGRKMVELRSSGVLRKRENQE